MAGGTADWRSRSLPRDHWQRRIADLDPEVDWAEIYAIALEHEFPWDMEQALSLALFRTFAVPEIGELLADTGEFTTRTQKRYDDTAIVLQEVGDFVGGESVDPTGIRRLNRMHAAYAIPNDQMLYVLATFVVVPQRWIRRYGYRPLSDAEIASSVRYWQRVGRLMGIHDVPADFDGFAAYLDDYERDRFGYSPGGRSVSDATLDLFVSWWPAPLRGAVRSALLAVLDRHLLQALRYDAPPGWWTAAVRGALVARGRVVGLLPARRERRRATDSPRIKGYPSGWDIAAVGTFPPAGADVAGRQA